MWRRASASSAAISARAASGGQAIDLGLVDRVLGVVEQPVDAARQRRRRPRAPAASRTPPQRRAQLALGLVGAMLAVADGPPPRRRRRPRPRRRPFPRRHRDLVAQKARPRPGVSGRNHRARLIASHLQTASAAAASDGGRRHRDQPRQAHVAHDRPVDVVPAPASAAHAHAPTTRRPASWRPGAPTSDAPRITPAEAPLLAQTVDRPDAIDAPADGLDDPPPAERGADGQRERRRRASTQVGGASCSDPPVGDQQRGDDADRLLRVVGPVAEGQRRRHAPTARRAPAPLQRRVARRPIDRSPRIATQRGQRRRAPARPPARSASRSTPTGCHAVQAAPADRVDAALEQPGADEPADERVPGARRQPEPPRQHVPAPPPRPARRR